MGVNTRLVASPQPPGSSVYRTIIAYVRKERDFKWSRCRPKSGGKVQVRRVSVVSIGQKIWGRRKLSDPHCTRTTQIRESLLARCHWIRRSHQVIVILFAVRTHVKLVKIVAGNSWKLSAEIRLNKIWMEKAIYKLSIHVSNLTQWVSRRKRTQPGLREYEKQMIWVINCERADTLRGRSLTPKEGMVMCKLWLRIWLCINIKFCGIIPACLGLKTATVVLLFFFTSW